MLVDDFKFGWRQLIKSPGFSLTAILTLGLAIGANTAVFSLVDAVLLRPLPYPQPDRLALLSLEIHRNGAKAGENTSHGGAVWEAVRDQATTVDAAVISGMSAHVSLAVGDQAVSVNPQRVSAGYFRVLGVAPAIGREFTREEDRVGGPAVVLLSDGLWRSAFGASPGVVGPTIRLKGQPRGIVVDQKKFAFGGDVMFVNGRMTMNPSFEGAGGGWSSTALDLARWARTLYEGRIVPAARIAEAVQGVPAQLGPDLRYGLGVIIWPSPRGPVWGHSGYFPGYITEMRYYPDAKVAVAFQMNSSVPRALGRAPGGLVNEIADVVRSER